MNVLCKLKGRQSLCKGVWGGDYHLHISQVFVRKNHPFSSRSQKCFRKETICTGSFRNLEIVAEASIGTSAIYSKFWAGCSQVSYIPRRTGHTGWTILSWVYFCIFILPLPSRFAAPEAGFPLQLPRSFTNVCLLSSLLLSRTSKINQCSAWK